MFHNERIESAYRRKERRRKAGIAVMSVLLLIVLLAIGCVSLLMLHGRSIKEFLPAGGGFEEETAAEEKDDKTGADEVKDDEEEIPDEEALVLSDAQLHRGNLILVNSEHPFDFEANEGLELWTLSEIEGFDFPVAREEFQVAAEIYPNLAKIMGDCNEAIGAGDTAIESAYRSLEYQQKIYDDTVKEYGEEYAAEYVADPGYSEHHTGFAVDFGCIGQSGATSFSDSNNAVWMSENCYKYGFIRRYQEDKVGITGISNEAWHFRYVGTCHATYMTQNNLCLEEYIDLLRSHTRDNALVVETNIGTYRVWYTDKQRVREPENDYVVSGNNIDGYIITENITGE